MFNDSAVKEIFSLLGLLVLLGTSLLKSTFDYVYVLVMVDDLSHLIN